MDYWRIRKYWNNGGWDKTQKGAFTSYEAALENYKEEYKAEDYKIFSPSGEILYPHHDITQMMIDDGLEVDSSYWNEAFKNDSDIVCEYAKEILCRYSQRLRDVKNSVTVLNGVEVINFNDSIEIYKVPVNLFKIKIVDELKKNVNYPSYSNAGYFATYKEADNNMMINFTLPVANLVADISFDDLPEVSHKYWKERKHTDSKIYFGANDNGPQFKGKNVSTLLIYDNNYVDIAQVNDIKVESIKYAVSGYPILLNDCIVPYAEALKEGWESGVTRNTSHPFVGIKGDGYIYIFGLTTTKTGKNMATEVYEKIKDFEFKSLIKLDGGGSTIIRYNDENKMITSENRRINSIITIG